MSNTPLFDEFSAVNAKAWKQKIQVDLKGADYNDTLVWESPEGIKVKPFYSEEDLDPAMEGVDIPGHGWSIGQNIYAESAASARTKCEEAIANGVESLVFNISPDQFKPQELFEKTTIENKRIYWEARNISPAKVAEAIENTSSNEAQIYILTDIIGNLASTGNWFVGLKEDFTELEKLSTSSEQVNLLGVDLSLYQNAGANRVQQLAYSIAHAEEYLNRLSTDLSSPIIFKVSVDTNYFFEIAKLRALRILWSRLAEEHNAPTSCHILAFPTRRNKTIYDYNVNMLRTTSECMAAILGGADTVVNLPYDHIYHHENEFAERIARNQLLILKNESYFDKVSNAASGTYYIEKLTDELVNKAWDLFGQIKSGGGFLQQLKEHKIQNKIKESAKKQQDAFDKSEEILVGSNKYPNEGDLMKEQLQKDPFLHQQNHKTLIEPILEKRLSAILEKKRLSHE